MGEVTKITHLLGKSPIKYPKGDMVFDVGTVLQSERGWPFTVINTDKNDYQADFGKPLRLREDGYQAWFALHVSENTIGHFVRVVADDAKYQHLSIYSDWLVDKTDTEWVSGTTFAAGDITHKGNVFYISQQADNTGHDPAVDNGTWWVPYIKPGGTIFSTTVAPAGDVMLIAILKNGVTEENKYGFAILNKNVTKETFDIQVYEKQADGTSKAVGDPLTVSVNQDAVNAMNQSIFIETVFANQSTVIQFKCIASPSFAKILEHGTVWFSGGAAGGTPTNANYLTAWNMLKDTSIDIDALFTAGDTDTVNIGYAAAVADERDARLEGDCQADVTVAAAVSWVSSLSLQSQNVCFTYGQISFNDPFYNGNRKYMRLSGLAIAAKAWAREQSKTIVDPGVEEAPAGEDFGLLRGVTGVRNEMPITETDKVTLAGAWINYIVNSTKKGLIFWEQFTLYGEECAYAYKDIVDVINYIYKIHKSIMQTKQFRKMSDQAIIDSLTPILKRFKTKGVLIPAKDDEEEFPDPYKVWVETVNSKRLIHRVMRFDRSIGPVILETIPV